MPDGQKSLHPFFSKAAGSSKHRDGDDGARAVINSTSDAPGQALDQETTEHGHSTLLGPNDSPEKEGPSPVTKRGRGKGRAKTKTSVSLRDGSAARSNPSTEDTVEQQSATRRKRQKLSGHVPANVQVEVEVPASSPQRSLDATIGGQGSEDMIVHASSPRQLSSSQPEQTHLSLRHEAQMPSSQPQGTHAPVTEQILESLPIPVDEQPLRPNVLPPNRPDADMQKDPPVKMMKLKAGGRLASPVKAASVTKEAPEPKKPAKRGRKKKERHLLVVCHYILESGIGHRIDLILSGEERHQLQSIAVKPPPVPPKIANVNPNKPAHPFFSGKPRPAPPTSNPAVAPADLTESPRKTSAVTPGKLRAQRQSQKIAHGDYTSVPAPFGNNRDRMISKQPGMTHPLWPAKGLSHIRGDFFYDTGDSKRSADGLAAPVTAGISCKMKRRVPILDPSESLLHGYCQGMNLDLEDSPRPDGFRNPPLSLRVPTRSLISGSQITHLVYKQLADTAAHPACLSMYSSIPTTLTPYDEGRSEVQAWAQKYAPMCAEDVLQPGKEAGILRDWMKALTVAAVDGFASQASTKLDKPDRKPKKKRRKRDEDLDDFIVNSDEEPGQLDELTEPEDLPSFQGSRPQKRSLVQTLNGAGKLSNAILISGPSGSGKSAMVHAVAKELGFEVFEINSGSRRSGKDVLDRVGDMVENHLVQRHPIVADTGNISADEDAGRLSEAFSKDLASGRQGTMASFFSSKSKQPPAVKKPVTQAKPREEQAQQTMTKAKSPRSQKQSLILLEEVDILFEEDKGFWPTVFTLISNSKRPVIMTCNDEDLVPIQAMTTHAILRLLPPPASTAADYLLLMAAKEGHILAREAVFSLYELKGQDLRASIADLQLWCQMGVGDPRCGLGWIYQRWPKGTGTDDKGLPIRVTSDATYQTGMGSFCHGSRLGESAEESIWQAWQDWGVDPRVRLFDGAEHAFKDDQVLMDKQARMKALRNYESFSETMSAMDNFGDIGLPDNTRIDTTDPPIAEKSRSNYINGMVLLQTPTVRDYSSLNTHLAVTSTLLATKIYKLPLNISTTALISEITTDDSREALTRPVFAHALEPLAYNANMPSFSTPSLTYTCLDGPFKPIAIDIAPYVRSIAAFDLALEAQRALLGGTEAGVTKKTRTTRAARSALEGGQRSLTRRERWFAGTELDFNLVLGTGGEWPRLCGGNAEADLDSIGMEVGGPALPPYDGPE